ncbi:hypothetical protein [Paenimyroides aestuarii]|uniref:Uncharacterized protein n=1 Tax=Paenimyroides aestuarii TaxID=2968490 RepID=A0ABY5NU00_9FLAO|nr:hypothetical protein [Paenimyroides aestuarii]UUV21867.1 hypothetical protein NPX36_02100 [Paenimyroides aestuarii]
MKSGMLLFVVFFVSCKINQTKNGLPVGRWKYSTTSKTERSVIKAKYDANGKEKGVWKYYSNDTLTRLEKYYYPYSVDVLYHKNGKISEIGKSFTTKNSWTKVGTWFLFNENEQLIDSITFETQEAVQKGQSFFYAANF